ncbi:MAG: hypothetical protein GKS00_23680 [Alphaproteobacteria bacterium]|nr:hypothetical protein [Alphaproteobacteria bacterium]
MRRLFISVFTLFLWAANPALSDSHGAVAEKTMTVERMNDLIEAIGDDVQRNNVSQWRFLVEKVPVFVIADAPNDRMRVLVGISKTEDLPEGLYQRLMQANFDTTLDARYAVAKGVIWGAFLHPLKALTDRLFLSGVGQTVNLARTFGKTFSSGGLTYQGGDSAGIIERELIENLLEKGLAI